SRIAVAVEKGEVTLSGSVEHRRDKRRAEDLVDVVSGVRHVQNNIRVQRRDAGQGSTQTPGQTDTDKTAAARASRQST
ncbi:MAG: BON domain-containing protein, partial [Hyphomonadaceae bacterium]|nr:BON domain-containing protein [Hyphomonadaceae bacterium]